jgi:hypothetical protein
MKIATTVFLSSPKGNRAKAYEIVCDISEDRGKIRIELPGIKGHRFCHFYLPAEALEEECDHVSPVYRSKIIHFRDDKNGYQLAPCSAVVAAPLGKQPAASSSKWENVTCEKCLMMKG